MKKKIISACMAGVMALSMAGCANTSAGSDMDYIKEKGTLVVGITDFAPMDYQDENGEWIGFDADLAKAFAGKMGVEVKFVEIDWDGKIMELDGKTIDCVWNGMTLTDEVTSAMNCSKAYLNNAQIVVVKEGTDTSDLTKLSFAVESGSAGEAAAKDAGYKYVGVKDQATALMEVESGTSDATIIDSLMAGAMIGEGTSYADLITDKALTEEQYGVGFRKESDLTEELNKFFADSMADGSMKATAEKYGVQMALIEK